MVSSEMILGLMRIAIEQARRSKKEDKGIHPMVGAVIADSEGRVLHTAYRGEEKGCHAEYLCLKKAEEASRQLRNCMLFVTLEPCTARGSGKKACVKRIIESGLGKVYIGMLDANPAICGRGETRLRYYTEVERFPSELEEVIRDMNKEFVEHHKEAHLSEQSMYVTTQIHEIMRDYLVRRGLKLDDELPVGVDLTTADIMRICEAGLTSGENNDLDVCKEVEDARAEAFDKKYAERTYDNDGRGLGDYWKDSVLTILKEMEVVDFTKRRVVVVGIGNGLEGKDLYAHCENMLAVDIGEKSLEQAKKVLPKAKMQKACAEKLLGVESASQDIYISLRTYQSSYFDRNAALRQAYRVVRQGGIVLVSVANGFLEQGSMIPGLLIPGTAIVDRNLGFHIADQVRSRMSLLRFEEIGMRTSVDEIYVYGRRAR
ncbi:MAG: methyltransferase domain-containing protein [Planctomycetota bacterium]|jgi:pyrimidine deaminase RibD-like protein/SAM-dependent methyltransferase